MNMLPSGYKKVSLKSDSPKSGEGLRGSKSHQPPSLPTVEPQSKYVAPALNETATDLN
jgi:hypothetical protein